MIQLPSGAHTNPLPLILLQLAVIFAVPLSPVAAPLLSVHWPSLVNVVPGKERKRGSVTKARFSHKIVKEQSGRLSNIKQKGNTSHQQSLCLLLCQCQHPLPPPMNMPSLPHTLPSILPIPLLLLMIPLLIRQFQMNQGDLPGKSGEQMLDLMDQLLKKGGTHTAMKLYDTEGRDKLIPEKGGESNLCLNVSLPPCLAQQLLTPLVPSLLPAPMCFQPPLISVAVTHSKMNGSKS